MPRSNWFWIALIVVLLVLQYRLWVDDGSYPDLWLKEQSIQQQIQQNRQTETENAALKRETNGIKTNPAVIEGHAREQLDMIEEGETFYLFADPE